MRRGEKGKRGSYFWGRGLEDRRGAAACFLRKAKGSDALSILFLSPRASGGSPCSHSSLIQSLHPAQRNVPCPQSHDGTFVRFLSSRFDLFSSSFDLLSVGYSCC